MPRDVPLLRSEASGTESGDFAMGGASGAYVRRPLHLVGRDDIRAAYVQTDRVKRYPFGEVLLLEKLKPPSPGDYAVIEMVKRDGEALAPAHLGEVTAVTASKITLAQNNPNKTFDLERKKIANLYRVITLAEILGG